ncbi:MAG: hypothetical protein ACR2QJ_15270, partial [Geminicoccaceae bacterium]
YWAPPELPGIRRHTGKKTDVRLVQPRGQRWAVLAGRQKKVCRGTCYGSVSAATRLDWDPVQFLLDPIDTIDQIIKAFVEQRALFGKSDPLLLHQMHTGADLAQFIVRIYTPRKQLIEFRVRRRHQTEQIRKCGFFGLGFHQSIVCQVGLRVNKTADAVRVSAKR